MGRSPCSSKERAGLNRGAWTAQEDRILRDYIAIHGVDGGWEKLSKQAAGLTRSGRSCRLRWLNYLHPDVIRGNISPYEEDLIVRLHGLLGNRWSLIAGRLPGRTDNEIKNYWKTHLSRKRFRVNKESSSNKKSVLLEQNPREIFHCKRTSACPNYNSPELHVQNHVFKPLALRPMVDINLFETEVQNVSTSRSMSSLTEQKSPGPHDHAAEAATVADSFLDLSELYCHFLSSPSDSSTYLIGLEDFCSTILAADNIHEFEDIMGSVQSNMQQSTILQ